MARRQPFRFKGASPGKNTAQKEFTREEAINLLVQERVQLHPFFLPSHPMPLNIMTAAGPQTRDARGLTKVESVALTIFAATFQKGAFGIVDSTLDVNLRQAFRAAELFLTHAEAFKLSVVQSIKENVAKEVDRRVAETKQATQPNVHITEVPDEDDRDSDGADEDGDEPEDIG